MSASTEKTILDLYRHDVDNPRPKHYYYYYPGGHRTISTEDFFRRTAALASALEGLGVAKGDRVMLLSGNRPEWHMVDLATVDLGAADVPIYGTLTAEQVAYQAQDSGAKVAVAEDAEQMAKFLEIRDQCPDLEHLIKIDGTPAEGVQGMDEVIATGDTDSSQELFWQRAQKVSEDDLLTLIYTSGTTGKPKGVSLTHRNLVQNVLPSALRAPLDKDDFCLEFLPLCHVFERMLGYLYMAKATTKAYCSVYHVGDLVSEIRPTVFAGVPRFYEKVYDKVIGAVSGASGLRQALFHWAQGVGERATPALLAGKAPSDLGFGYRLADKLVLSKVRAKLGGQLRFCVSGGAPLPQFVNEFFHSMGIRILEGYGLTETSPVIAVNGFGPGDTRLGTVGKALENLEVKIAEDGELLVKGPSITAGYWNLPEKTDEVFDDEGFFHTGDIAQIEDDKCIRITDRKKDLIVTAGGKNVAPQPIENQLKRSPFVDNAVLIGDRRAFIVALFSPNDEELEKWAKAQGISYGSFAELTTKPEVFAIFQEVVDAASSKLARYEQIKKFAVLPSMLSIDTGHLTPTLKVKRRIVEKDYAELIDKLYS